MDINKSTMNNLSNEFTTNITEFDNTYKSQLCNEKNAQISAKMALSNLHKKYEEIIDASEEIANFKEISVLNTVVVQSIEEREIWEFYST